jgi:antitoxin ParD1/3/4
MSRSRTFDLGDLARFVERKVAEGRYASPSDVVRDGLRLLERREIRLESAREALKEGEASGEATPFDFEGFISRKKGPDVPAR